MADLLVLLLELLTVKEGIVRKEEGERRECTYSGLQVRYCSKSPVPYEAGAASITILHMKQLRFHGVY